MRVVLAWCLLAFVGCANAQGFTVEWDDGVAPDIKHYKMSFPPEVLSALAGAVTQVVPTTVKPPIRPPQVVLPGDGSRAIMPDKSVISLGAGGEIYRDAVQLPGVLARQAVQYGITIYAQGKTNPSWWKWTGTTWTQVVNIDAAILK